MPLCMCSIGFDCILQDFFRCPWCKLTSLSKPFMYQHVKEKHHGKKIPCPRPDCTFQAVLRETLNSHFNKEHGGAPPFGATKFKRCSDPFDASNSNMEQENPAEACAMVPSNMVSEVKNPTKRRKPRADKTHGSMHQGQNEAYSGGQNEVDLAVKSIMNPADQQQVWPLTQFFSVSFL